MAPLGISINALRPGAVKTEMTALEFGPDAEVFSVCDGPGTIAITLKDLLPQAFGSHNLNP